MPKKRMPYTLTRIVDALGWPNGAVNDVLAGDPPPGGVPQWTEVPAPIDPGETAAAIIHDAMVRTIETATTVEIRTATRIALDELRRQGILPETNETQPTSTT